MSPAPPRPPILLIYKGENMNRERREFPQPDKNDAGEGLVQLVSAAREELCRDADRGDISYPVIRRLGSLAGTPRV